MAWLTTEAVIIGERNIQLGNTRSSFMAELGLIPTGGRWGSITRLQDQTKRLFTSSISCSYQYGKTEGEKGFRVADGHDLWWYPKSPDQSTLFESNVRLSEVFFNEITNHPVPIDPRTLKAIKRSPMAIDIYCWLTYRMSYLKSKTEIPWPVLQMQFDSAYSTESSQDIRDFKRAFLRELKKIDTIYSTVRVGEGQIGLVLMSSNTHIGYGLHTCKKH